MTGIGLENISIAVMSKQAHSLEDMKLAELLAAIKCLPKDLLTILDLRYSEQLPMKEIAIRMNLSLTTTYNKANRALFYLKNKCNPEALGLMYKILYPDAGKPSDDYTIS